MGKIQKQAEYTARNRLGSNCGTIENPAEGK